MEVEWLQMYLGELKLCGMGINNLQHNLSCSCGFSKVMREVT